MNKTEMKKAAGKLPFLQLKKYGIFNQESVSSLT